MSHDPVNPLYTNSRYNNKICYNDNLNVTKSLLKKWRLMWNYARKLHKIFKQHIFWYLLELPQRGNSNKYPKHMFYEEIRIKQGFSYIPFCPLRILYNNKFIIMATFLETNAVIATRVHCRYFDRKWSAKLKHFHTSHYLFCKGQTHLFLNWHILWFTISNVNARLMI